MNPPGGAEPSMPVQQVEDLTPRINRQFVRLVLDSGYLSTISFFALAAGLAVFLRHGIAIQTLVVWMIINTLLAGGRILAVYAYHQKRDLDTPEKLFSVRVYRTLVSATGLTWGIGVWFLLPNHSPSHEMLFLISMAGLAAGALPVLAPMIRLYTTYIASFLLPGSVLLFFRPGEIHLALGFLTLFYLAVLVVSATRMHGLMVEALRHQYANEAMVETLEVAREAAEAASRGKSEFLANMSHEIRTPMNGVLGTLQLLRQIKADPPHHELVSMAHHSAESLLHLLDDILDYSRVEAGRLSLQRIPMNLAALIQLMKDTLPPFPEGSLVVFETEVDPQLDRPLIGDPDRIRQILTNLLSNAMKFTEFGRITLSASVAGPMEGGLRVRLQVADTGIGIAKADQPKLFQSFSQVDASLTRKYGGSGLGLAIVRQLTQLMKGSWGLESDLGQGSRVWCEIPFPFATAPTGVSGGFPAFLASSAFTGEVLLVEDNPVNQKIALAMLKKLGLAVSLAHDGQEALDILGQQRFSAVLMDCQMPRMDGYTATSAWREREAREGLPRTPIIALTAHAMKGDREKCLEAGMDDYLAKPVKLTALATTLKKWLEASPSN